MKMTAKDAAQKFGVLADQALQEPVTITKHGRDHLVVISAQEYTRLMKRDRKVMATADMPDDLRDALETVEIPDDGGKFDHEVE